MDKVWKFALKRTANDIDTKVALLAALFLYLYDTNFMQGASNDKWKEAINVPL